MGEQTTKRHVGVIPPHEIKHRKYIEEFKQKISGGWRILPDSLFYKLSYQRLLTVARSGASYHVAVVSRMRDQENQEQNNVYSAANEIRNGLGMDTVFIVSFNELLATMRGHDPRQERSFIDKLIEHGEDPGKKPIGGVILTSSTDPFFILSIIADILDNPKSYLDKKPVLNIESQSQFLNHPPGDTHMGIRQ